MAKRKRYDDKFRASAVVMLEAAGYPGKKGALVEVAKHLGISHQLLSNWARAAQNPPPQELLQEKRADLKELLDNELRAALGAMASVRPDAAYRELGTVAGILFDKLQLLEGKPTDRTEIVDNTDRANRLNALLDTARARRDGRAADSGEYVQ